MLLMPMEGFAQWVEVPGHGWANISVYHHDTRKRFDPSGDVVPLFNEGGRSVSTSFYLTTVAGVFRGVDAWIQVPYNFLEFNDVVDDRRSVGIGDPRLHLRMGPALFGLKPVPIAIRTGVKIPLGKYTPDAEVIPLSEGQWDWEVMLEGGYSFYPRTIYIMGWIGYRWRGVNEEIGRKSGDERFAYAAAGGSIRSFTWKFAVEGLSGLAPRRILPSGLEIPLPLDKRDLLQLLPSVGHQLGPGHIELGLRIPVAGRNLPAGTAVFIGYFFRWDWIRS